MLLIVPVQKKTASVMEDAKNALNTIKTGVNCLSVQDKHKLNNFFVADFSCDFIVQFLDVY